MRKVSSERYRRGVEGVGTWFRGKCMKGELGKEGGVTERTGTKLERKV